MIKRIAVAVSALCLTVTACAGSTSRSGTGGSEAGTQPSVRLERTVSVYASLIRRLVTIDHPIAAGGPVSVVYVVDGVVEGAQHPGSLGEPKPETPFNPPVKRTLRKALSDLPPLEFVKDQNAVIPGLNTRQPAPVINNGVLLTLGPIKGNATRVEVDNNLWISVQAGQWLTYVLERRDTRWEVASTTGPIAIS